MQGFGANGVPVEDGRGQLTLRAVALGLLPSVLLAVGLLTTHRRDTHRDTDWQALRYLVVVVGLFWVFFLRFPRVHRTKLHNAYEAAYWGAIAGATMMVGIVCVLNWQDFRRGRWPENLLGMALFYAMISGFVHAWIAIGLWKVVRRYSSRPSAP